MHEENEQETTPPEEFNLTPSAHYAYQIYQEHIIAVCHQILKHAETSGVSATPEELCNFPSRTDLAFSYFRNQLTDIFRWLFRSKEIDNFTYDITEQNKNYLSALVSTVAQIPVSQARGYLEEINADQMLKAHIKAILRQSPDGQLMDETIHYGRRIGWYALARARKPRVIVETGVHKGFGACVLCAALKKNAEEGFRGQYIGIDIDPTAGILLQDPYREMGEIMYGDAIQTIQKLTLPIDFYINDSDHSADYEMDEYHAIASKLTQDSIILGDNAHVTDKLFHFAQESERKFAFFPEIPQGHWYPGAGIGIAYR
ncbi:MAG: class I SAM-dependent methyltransferase [Bdellovibrionales bacterium]|nr:class I SAM-dependent methyltransferase [Bdellovibrionales bacterium]